MDKQLARKINELVWSDSWSSFEQYLQQELDRAYIKFNSAKELQEFSAVQAEIRLLKKLLNLKESIRQSLEN